MVAAAIVAVALGALDGGTPTSPSGALGGEQEATTPTPPATAADRRAVAARADARAVDQTLDRLPFVAAAGRQHRQIALTFDDGPGPYTLKVMRTLRRLNAPATFFQLGFSEHWFTDAERAGIQDDRFVLGDHTQSHANLSRLTPEQQAAEIDQQAAVMTAAGAPYPRLFRPPYGRYDQATLDLLRDRRMLMVLWSIDSQDYLRPGVDAIVRRVLDQARPGAIVLLHDAGGDRSQTVAALPRIVKGLRKRGYRLVTVPRLLRDNPPPERQERPAEGVG